MSATGGKRTWRSADLELDVLTCFGANLSEQARDFGQEVPHRFGQLIRTIYFNPKGRLNGIDIATAEAVV